MGDKKPAQVIQPPRTLQHKFGGGSLKLTADAINKAEAAMAELADNSGATLLHEIDQLRRGVDAYKNQRKGDLTDLFRLAFDLKGLGSSMGFPFLTALGVTLCQMFEQRDRLSKLDYTITMAHIDAMTAIVSNDIRGKENKTGQAILDDLTKLITLSRQASRS